MKQFDIDGETYQVDFPAGYEWDGGRIAWKSDRPGLYGKNAAGKVRWFRSKIARYLKHA